MTQGVDSLYLGNHEFFHTLLIVGVISNRFSTRLSISLPRSFLA